MSEKKVVYRSTQAEKKLKEAESTLERLVAILGVMIDDMIELGKLGKQYRHDIDVYMNLQDRKTRLLSGIQKTIQDIYKMTDGKNVTTEEDEKLKEAEELISSLPKI